MKKSTITLALAAALFGGNISAQNLARNCGSTEYKERQELANPEIAQNRQLIEDHTSNFNPSNRTGSVANIPVVVHVLYNTTSQNISDAQILSQINVLNADFRNLNADRTNRPAVFAGLAADASIEFCLAKRTPSGAATTGIVRKQTSTTSFGSNDGMKYSAQGGDDAWNTSQYLNLWVCNLGEDLLGYAQFPGGPAATDGVVVLYLAFGSTGTLSAPYNKGRTTTHEVGHWLNLRHIWGDASCGSDLVSDTPTQQTSNYGSPTHPHATCSNSGDMFMNYMDYVDDAAMNMFSAGQKTRMAALFASGGSRASLNSSLGCVAPSGTTTTCGVPSGLATSSITSTSAIVSWTSTGAASYKLNYKKTAATTWSTYTSAGTSVSLTGLTASTGYQFQVQSICGTTSSALSTTASFTTTATTTATTSTLTIGTSTSTTSVAPYGSYYMDERAQIIVTKAELVAAGYTSVNSYIKSLGFNAGTASAQVLNAFTISVSHTTATSLGTSFITGTNPTTVYSKNVTIASNTWAIHTFTTPFAYNGTSNILIDICFNNSSYTTNSTVYATATTSYMTLYKRSDIAAGGLCTTTTGTQTYSRPNMKLTLGSNSAASREGFGIEEEPIETIETNSKPKISTLAVSPNPSNGNANITFDVYEENTAAKIQVYSIYGSLVAEYNYSDLNVGENTKDISFNNDEKLNTLSNGVYVITLNVNNETSNTKLVLTK